LPEVFLVWGEELFASHPVREVRFVTGSGAACGPDVAEELAAAPAFRHVRALDASGSEPSAGPGWCRALAGASHLDRLEELNLSSAWHQAGVFHDLEALAELCQAEHLKTLRKLVLAAPLAVEAFGDEAVQTCLQAPFAAHLEALDLSGWHLSEAGARALAGSRKLRRLEELELAWCEGLSRNAIQYILDSPHLGRLARLSLGGDIDLHALAAAPLLGQLERLDLCTASMRYFRSFPPDAWARLAASPYIGRLRRLSLLHGLLDDDSASQLLHTPGPLRLHSLMVIGMTGHGQAFAGLIARSPALADLTALELVACDISHEAVGTLMQAPFVGNLHLLCLAGNRIQARGLLAVLASPLSAGSLDDLHLHHCDLPPGALRRLFRWRGLANVTRLELGSNQLDVQTVEALARSPHLARLTTLHLGSGNFSSEALRALSRSGALPRLQKLTIASRTDPETIDELRKRFGPRLTLDQRE
jgi:hypothetical protein